MNTERKKKSNKVMWAVCPKIKCTMNATVIKTVWCGGRNGPADNTTEQEVQNRLNYL